MNLEGNQTATAGHTADPLYGRRCIHRFTIAGPANRWDAEANKQRSRETPRETLSQENHRLPSKSVNLMSDPVHLAAKQNATVAAKHLF